MRIARRLLLIAMLAFAAMSVNVSSASAVEVLSEPSTHCSAVVETPTPTPSVTGGCLIKVASFGHVELVNHSTGTVIRCRVTFDARVNEAGVGFAFNQVTNIACEQNSLVPCASSPHKHWDFAITGAANPFIATGTFCVVMFGFVTAECTVSGSLNVASHTSATLTVQDPDGDHKTCSNNQNLEIRGTFAVSPPAGGPNVEIRP